jgi:hypothetical protein
MSEEVVSSVMAIPENNAGSHISTLLVSRHFLPPDDQENFPLLDKEQGGIGLNDPSAGLNNIPWTLRYFPTTGDFVIESETTPPTIILNVPDVTEISFTFDQNMNPFIAFVEDGDAKFWWYDSEIPGTTTTNLPAGSLTPRCCLDDKRQIQAGNSDIILCYVLNGDLKKRIQRERYTAEDTLESPFLHPVFGLPAVLKRIGMHKGLRLQWLCDLANPIDWCGYVNYGN